MNCDIKLTKGIIYELNSLIEELRLKEGISRTHTRPILKEYSKSKLKKDQ